MAGFPEVHPKHYMTWRELRDRLNELPDRVLDMTAWVYVHGDGGLDGEIGVTSVTPYDNGPDSTINDDPEFSNHLSINIDD